jgi:hypothetical protein
VAAQSVAPRVVKKVKDIPVRGLWGCEMLRILYCLDNRLTDGGKIVSPMHRPRSNPPPPRKIFLRLVPGAARRIR